MLTPTNRQNPPPEKITDIRNIHSFSVQKAQRIPNPMRPSLPIIDKIFRQYVPELWLENILISKFLVVNQLSWDMDWISQVFMEG